MKLIRLLYLLCFFAPVAFLCGYIAGAPRYQSPSLDFNRIDARHMPVSDVEFYGDSSSIVIADAPWLEKNSSFVRPTPR